MSTYSQFRTGINKPVLKPLPGCTSEGGFRLILSPVFRRFHYYMNMGHRPKPVWTTLHSANAKAAIKGSTESRLSMDRHYRNSEKMMNFSYR
jgi:hypothetical protein